MFWQASYAFGYILIVANEQLSHLVTLFVTNNNSTDAQRSFELSSIRTQYGNPKQTSRRMEIPEALLRLVENVVGQ